MKTDPAETTSVEDLRRAELERREKRRQARESGATAPLRARRRETQDERSAQESLRRGAAGDNPAGEGHESPVLLRLPTGVTDVLQRAAAEVGDPGFLHDSLVRTTDSPDPAKAVAAGAIELLSRATPLSALGYLLLLTTEGLPLLTDEECRRAEAMRSDRLPPPATHPDHIDAWQLHLEAAEAHGRAVLGTAAWQRLVERLPLPVLDDLIDHDNLRRNTAPHTWPEQNDRVRYVTARLDPGALADSDVDALEWRDEACRRILCSGGTVEALGGRYDEWSSRSALLGGELSVLDASVSYEGGEHSAGLADLVSSLQRIRRGGPVDGRLGRDRSLFGLLEDCVPDDRPISGSTAFHYWAGTRRMYRLLDDMHWSLACEPEQTDELLRATFQQVSVLRNRESRGTAGMADCEARAVEAYLCFLRAGPADRDQLDRSVGLLEDVLKRGGSRRGGVDGGQRRRLIRLSELLQSLRRKSKPQGVLNPYLALCVEHGSTEWRQGWRDLRRQVATEQIEYINGAKDRIQRTETSQRLGAEAEVLYELPLNERFLWVPNDRNEMLQPSPWPLERRTGASTEFEQEWTATEAAREIIGSCAERLRNDP